MKHILSVDIGTTSSKALVVNEKGEVLAQAQEFYPTYHPQPDYSEQDPKEIYRAVVAIIRATAEKVNGKVDGVCFSSAMHSLILTDSAGEALTPMITWADMRSKWQAHELKNRPEGQIIYKESGTPIHPMSPLCKLLWFAKHEPRLFSQTSRFVGIREYIGAKLFGEFDIDYSIAAATGYFNNVTKGWSETALKFAGIGSHQLSTPRPVSFAARIKDEKIARDLGLNTGIPFFLGGSDGALAHLGSGAMDSDTLSVTVGTSGAVRKAVKGYKPDEKGRTFHYSFEGEEVITGGATNNGAVLVQWYSEKFLNEKVNVRAFGERAVSVPHEKEGLIFLPYVLGERAPVYDVDATGVFFGVRNRHGAEHFMRAILEGIGYALYSISEIVEANSGVCNRVVASGGFIKSSHWVQIVTDIFGKEFHVLGAADASALGAAMLGFKSLGVTTDFQFPAEKKFYPDMENHKNYMRDFRIFKNLYPHLAQDFADHQTD